MMLKCTKCNRGHVDANKWWLDRALKTQAHLVANKPKYSKTTFEKKYMRTQGWIRSLDYELYKLGRD